MGVVLKVLNKYINRKRVEKMGLLRKDQAKTFLENTKGRFFTVEHIKKDGTVRKTNARVGVKKYLKGVGLSYDPAKKGLLTVYDIQAKGYRTVNLNTVMNIRFKGVSIDILRDDSFDYRSN